MARFLYIYIMAITFFMWLLQKKLFSIASLEIASDLLNRIYHNSIKLWMRMYTFSPSYCLATISSKFNFSIWEKKYKSRDLNPEISIYITNALMRLWIRILARAFILLIGRIYFVWYLCRLVWCRKKRCLRIHHLMEFHYIEGIFCWTVHMTNKKLLPTVNKVFRKKYTHWLSTYVARQVKYLIM